MLATTFFEKMTVMDWRVAFGEHRRIQGKSENTIKANLSDLAVFERCFFQTTQENFSPDKLSGWALRTFRAWSVNDEKVEPATWNRRLASLSEFVKWAKKTGYLDESLDVLYGILRAEEITPPAEWLTANDYARLMRQIERSVNQANTNQRKELAKRNMAMIGFMLHAGLRVEEVIDLEIGDVQIAERGGLVVVRKGKGAKKRKVKLNSEARRFIKPWLDTCKTTRLFPITTRDAQICVAEIGKDAGINNLHPHRLRHTFGKRAADGGARLEEIRRLMGHESPRTTMRYLEPGDEDLAEAAEAAVLGKTNLKGEQNGRR